MGVSLYEHQKEALKKMHNGCILCGGVGSGKSRTALAYYYIQQGADILNGWKHGMIDGWSPMAGTDSEYEENDIPITPKDLYIITTAKKRDSGEWDSEMVPFLLFQDPSKNLYSNQIVVDSWNNIKRYTEVKDAFFIFDEQRVVGTGVWVKSFLKITKQNEWILLTATPGDTWLDYGPVFVANGYFKNISDFKRNHVIYNYYGSFPKVDRYYDTGKLIKYRREVLVPMNYKRPTIPHFIDYEVDYDIQDYKLVMRDRWSITKNEPIQNASGLCYELRYVTNTHSSRRHAVEEIVEEHPRVIIFYSFDYELEILKSLDYPLETYVAEWNGHKHEPIPNTESWVYLVNYTAGAEGWNCTSTDTIIFYSQQYSYKTLIQARGRIDRLNTKYQDLYYYTIKSKSPIDIAISRALANKRKFDESKFVNSI